MQLWLLVLCKTVTITTHIIITVNIADAENNDTFAASVCSVTKLVPEKNLSIFTLSTINI